MPQRTFSVLMPARPTRKRQTPAEVAAAAALEIRARRASTDAVDALVQEGAIRRPQLKKYMYPADICGVYKCHLRAQHAAGYKDFKNGDQLRSVKLQGRHAAGGGDCSNVGNVYLLRNHHWVATTADNTQYIDDGKVYAIQDFAAVQHVMAKFEEVHCDEERLRGATYERAAFEQATATSSDDERTAKMLKAQANDDVVSTRAD